MKGFVTRLSITRQFTAVVILGVVLTLAGTGLALKRSYDLAFDAKRTEIVHILENAQSLVEFYAGQARRGEIAVSEAKSRAVDALQAQRYDGGNFIFVFGTDGIMISYPRKELIGTNMILRKDPYGITNINNMIDAINAGRPALEYYSYPRPGETVPVRKMSYGVLVPEWGWILATGLYIDDIEAELISSAARLAAIFLPLFAIYLILAVWLRRLAGSLIGSLTQSVRAIAAGNLEVPIPGSERRDEIGQMSLAVQVLRDNSVKLRDSEARRARHEADRDMVMETIAGGLHRLARGDLNCQLDRAFPAEYEALSTDFSMTAQSLRAALRSIAQSSQTIRMGTDEIALASHDLARRNEQQAANLDGTASELSLITRNVENMAASASQASQAVTATRQAVELSDAVMGRAMEAMERIKDSSERISQIVALIDDIAFRTNLLSLNAEIEAASAGEAGRGFAVVAGEVRTLANRSKGAANEIKGLISSAAHHIENGVDLVGQTGAALKEIIGQAARIDTLVLDMANFARAQASSLTQINRALGQIDEATQQNSTMAEESTAASHSLAMEAALLDRLVGRFQLGAPAALPLAVDAAA